MAPKDGLLDKLQDIIEELDKEGYLVQVTGIEVDALREMHCDVCRLVTLQNLLQGASLELLYKYRKLANASSH